MINERINISIRATSIDPLLFIRCNRSLGSCFICFYVGGEKEREGDSLSKYYRKNSAEHLFRSRATPAVKFGLTISRERDTQVTRVVHNFRDDRLIYEKRRLFGMRILWSSVTLISFYCLKNNSPHIKRRSLSKIRKCEWLYWYSNWYIRIRRILWLRFYVIE